MVSFLMTGLDSISGKAETVIKSVFGDMGLSIWPILFLTLSICVQAFLTSCSCKFSVLSWSGACNQKYLIYFHTSELKCLLIFLLVGIVMNTVPIDYILSVNNLV